MHVIPASAYLYERVHTFPEAVDLGVLRLEDSQQHPEMLSQCAQTLMIYQEGGSDFQVKIATDIAALDVKWEPGPKGDRFQATITLMKEKLQVGDINGFLLLDTNDSEFPKLRIPVHGRILPLSDR